jgi:hypothetical protein
MQRPRIPSKLPESVHRQLNAYALAATAAGVGVLALTHPAEARIVYTRTHKLIQGQGQNLGIDLNHDGIVDFFFHRGTSALSTTSLRIRPAVSKNYIWGTPGAFARFASALPARFNIKSSKHFSNKSSADYGAIMYFKQSTSQGNHRTSGQWGGSQNRSPYLGLQFEIRGRRHYGWARVSIHVNPPLLPTYYLTGYAYETIPGKPIVAGKTHSEDDIDPVPGASLTNPVPDIPQPASLGALALGVRGLSIWRRRELVGAEQ